MKNKSRFEVSYDHADQVWEVISSDTGAVVCAVKKEEIAHLFANSYELYGFAKYAQEFMPMGPHVYTELARVISKAEGDEE